MLRMSPIHTPQLQLHPRRRCNRTHPAIRPPRHKNISRRREIHQMKPTVMPTHLPPMRMPKNVRFDLSARQNDREKIFRILQGILARRLTRIVVPHHHHRTCRRRIEPVTQPLQLTRPKPTLAHRLRTGIHHNPVHRPPTNHSALLIHPRICHRTPIANHFAELVTVVMITQGHMHRNPNLTNRLHQSFECHVVRLQPHPVGTVTIHNHTRNRPPQPNHFPQHASEIVRHVRPHRRRREISVNVRVRKQSHPLRPLRTAVRSDRFRHKPTQCRAGERPENPPPRQLYAINELTSARQKMDWHGGAGCNDRAKSTGRPAPENVSPASPPLNISVTGRARA